MKFVNPQPWFLSIAAMILAGSAMTQQSPVSLSDDELRKLRYKVLESESAFACQSVPTEELKSKVDQALAEFPAIRNGNDNDRETFRVITRHLGLEKLSNFGPDEKLLVYCDYETLKAIRLEPRGNKYKVFIGASPPPLPEGTSEASGMYIDREGHIDNLIVGTSVGFAVSPPIRDLPPSEWTPPPAPPIHVQVIDHPELRYRLVDRYGALLCPDDSGPGPVRKGWSERILETLPQIQKDRRTFQLIAQHLGLEGRTEFSDEQKIAVYHEYLKLGKIQLEPLVKKFEFMLTAPGPETRRYGLGLMITGLIAPEGEILVLRTQPYSTQCPR